MSACDEFLQSVHDSFPVEPVPVKFFWPQSKRAPGDDLSYELTSRLVLRRWTDVALLDWTMIGSPGVARQFLEPAAFAYYLPSVLVGVFSDLGYREFAINAVLPFNQDRRPRDAWWFAFVASLSPAQRTAIARFPAAAREALGATLDEWTEMELSTVQALWPR